MARALCRWHRLIDAKSEIIDFDFPIDQETDSEKLMQLVRQLCDACDRQQANVRSEEQFPAA